MLHASLLGHEQALGIFSSGGQIRFMSLRAIPTLYLAFHVPKLLLDGSTLLLELWESAISRVFIVVRHILSRFG